MKNIGTSVYGIRCPIINKGDNLVDIVIRAIEDSEIEIKDKDVIGITESVVARSQGNYATIDDIAGDIKKLYGPSATIGLVFPIMSRNRFSMILKGICRAASKVIIMFSYPNDEKGNPICDIDKYDELNITNVPFGRNNFEEVFGVYKHPFTGINYFDLYESIAKEENCEISFIVNNNPKLILNYTKNILVCDIHTRLRTKKRIGLDCNIHDLTEICSDKCEYGVLGSNKATEDSLKLFPKKCINELNEIADYFFKTYGKKIEVMVYGDGCFHDPVAGIWEFADPVTSPSYTIGLEGTPNEIKLKFLADNDFKDFSSGNELDFKVKEVIKNKKQETGAMGTTPRRYVDLLASLMDLTSGSGDKGTPIILVQGYFKNYGDD